MMDHRSFDPKTYTRRNSNRLPSYDYRSSGAYFITICTEKRQRVLEIPLIRTALLEKWQQLPQRFPSVRLDEFVIMPDHVHGILWLDGTVKGAPTLGGVIGAFKAWVTIAWRNYHREANKPCLTHLWHVVLSRQNGIYRPIQPARHWLPFSLPAQSVSPFPEKQRLSGYGESKRR